MICGTVHFDNKETLTFETNYTSVEEAINEYHRFVKDNPSPPGFTTNWHIINPQKVLFIEYWEGDEID